MTDRGGGGQVGAVLGPQPDFTVITGEAARRVDFDTLFEAHYGFVCRALRSMQVDAASVEDLAQDVFIVLHRRLADYDANREIRSWLWGIARRVASTHARSAQRAQRRLHAVRAEPRTTTAPDEQLELQRRATVVDQFLEALPQAHREVFVLIEIESMSAPQAAEALGIKLNTVYSRLRVARQRFQRAVARHRAREQRQAHA
ncbi:MAG: sigma-70 family RNA polymerase sigma factor [Deltaproteobacteria bacterium]|nr:sigma-70 family RNA polymerase sigma factor [Deltaproteobacteria bacterium]